MTETANHVQVQTTVERVEDARVLAGALVGEHHAACAQIVGPIESVYWWQGSLAGRREWIVLLKTSVAGYDELERRLRDLHPYEEPEVVALPITVASSSYLAWLDASLVPENE